MSEDFHKDIDFPDKKSKQTLDTYVAGFKAGSAQSNHSPVDWSKGSELEGQMSVLRWVAGGLFISTVSVVAYLFIMQIGLSQQVAVLETKIQILLNKNSSP